MTLNARGFPGTVRDTDWSKIIDLISHDGTSGMNVTPASGDRRVQIATGLSNVGGVLADLDAPLTAPACDPNTGSQARIDRLVLQARWSDKSLQPVILKGTPGSNPQPRGEDQRAGILWQTRLAQIRIDPGAGTLSSGDIFQERVPPVAGFYNVSSFRGFPDADRGALVWYGAANSLRIAVDGEYVEIAHARSEMLPDQAFSDSDFTYTSNVPAPTASGAGSVGRSFTAPPSGMVFVSISGRIQSNIDGNLALLGWEMRTGATLGGGSIRYAANANRAIIAGESVNQNAPNVIGATNRFLATGLSPGAVYHVRAMHWSSSSGKTSQYWSRNLVIEPV